MTTIITRAAKSSPLSSTEVDSNFVNLKTTADAALSKAGGALTGAVTTSSTIDGRDVSVDGTKLDGIEANATADQTNAEIRTAVEAASDSNIFTDADHSKLDGIATNANNYVLPSGYATETYVNTQVTNLVDSSPATLNTLNELAAALGDDPNFATTTATAIGTKAALSGSTFTGNLSLGDNVKLQLGNQTNGDLQIYHDGSASYIKENGTGDLIIQGSNTMRLQGSSNQELANFSTGGAVTLFNNGSAKIATTSTGTLTTGDVVNTGGLYSNVNNSLKIIGGGNASNAGSNLTLYGGTNASAGTFRFRNGTSVLTTITPTGIDVTGSVVADGLTVDGNGKFSGTTPIVRLTETDTTNLNTRLAHGGGYFFVSTENDAESANTPRISLNHTTGDISFYDSSGSSQNFYWDSSTSRLGLGTTAPNTNVQIYHATDDVSINVNHGTGGSYPKKSGISFGAISTSLGGDATFTGGAGIQVINTAAANAPTEMLFFTTSGGSPTERLKINADGSSVFSGAVSVGTVAQVFTSSDRGYFVAGTSDSSNQHLYLGSYHGSTLKELTFSGSNSAFYPQTSGAIDLGLTSKKFRHLHLSGSVTADSLTVDTGTVSASPSARFRRNHGGQAYQQLSGLSFYWNTSNGGHDNTIVYGASANSSLKFTQATGSAFNDTLTINSSGNAEFSGSVTTGSSLVSTNAIVDSVIAKTSGGNVIVKTNAGGSIARFNNNLSTDFFGSVTSTGLTVNATGSSYPTISHSNGNRIQLQPSYNYYNAYSHIFSSLNGTTNHLTIANTGNVNIPNGSLMVGATTAPEGQLTLQNDDASLRIRSNTTTTKGLTLKYNHAGNFGQLLVDHQGNNQLDMKYYALSHTFGRSDSLQFITINSSGSVGIGVTPSSKLTLADHSTAAGGIKFRTASSSVSLWSSGSGNLNSDASFNTTGRFRVVGGNAASDPDINFTGAASGTGFSRATNDITFITAATERARLTSSGDLFLGTTVNVFAGADRYGYNFYGNGQSNQSIDGSNSVTAQYINRENADGAYTKFYKDRAEVGSIGVANGDLNINGDTGIRFQDTSIMPRRAGSDVDATVDIGLSSHRWKDLYLSSGVYLGGTGSANKLDDYEEGTWTPAWQATTSTINVQSATYTKIGNLVTVHAYISNIGPATSQDQQYISGLPFTCSGSNHYGTGTIGYSGSADVEGLGVLVNSLNNLLYFHYIDGTSGSALTRNNWNAIKSSGLALIFSATYRTDS